MKTEYKVISGFEKKHFNEDNLNKCHNCCKLIMKLSTKQNLKITFIRN